MDEKQLDAMKFAVNEKANNANNLTFEYIGIDRDKVNFYQGQFQAYSEIYTMLCNIQT